MECFVVAIVPIASLSGVVETSNIRRTVDVYKCAFVVVISDSLGKLRASRSVFVPECSARYESPLVV